MSTNPTLSFFLIRLSGGGAERSVLRLAEEMARTWADVDIVVAHERGPYLDEVPDTCELVPLGVPDGGTVVRMTRVCLSLARYLGRRRPDSMLTTLDPANVVAPAAARLAPGQTRLVARQGNMPSTAGYGGGRFLPRLLPYALREADRIVAVSEGVRASLVGELGLPPEDVTAIPNPVDRKQLTRLAGEPTRAIGLEDYGGPLLLGMGRLSPQKDFETLVRAFALVREEIDAKLVILGEGDRRARLERCAEDAGVARHVLLPGFVQNPFPHLERADVFALTSRWEGMPNVLLQALALGTPAVATDAPGGSSEVLSGPLDRFLRPVGAPSEVADGILEAFRDPPSTEELERAIRSNRIPSVAERYRTELLG